MIEFRSEALFETRILRRRVGATNIASNNLRGLAQLPDRPFKISNGEAASFPIRHCIAPIETVKIDRDVNVFSAGRFQKLVKVLAPIITEDGAPALSIFYRTVVCPRMDLKNACAFGATVAENLVRPPAFKISATPNAHSAHLRKFQCAIHPSAAAPFRRTHIPIRMIVE